MSKKDFTNQEISRLLKQVAAVWQVKDNDFFRTRAYQNAAASIDDLTISAQDLYKQNKLDEIPGVGANLKQHLEELFKTGKVVHFQAELKKVPAGMFALLDIRGIGPKTAYKIATQFNLNSPKTALTKLKKLIKANKIATLPGFGPDSQQKILSSLKNKLQAKQRILLPDALNIADDLIAYLQKEKSIKHIKPLGSLRRRNATIGDIDIGLTTSKPQTVKNIFLNILSSKK